MRNDFVLDTALRNRRPDRMWFAATGLLVLMLVTYVVARLLEPTYPALVWMRAFAEAAMVGALADWFAVTALFRHPMGLPIPHTAILPRNKDRIGKNLGAFVERNFLAPEIVRERITGVDFVEALHAWLAESDRPRKMAERLAEQVPALLAHFDAPALREYFQDVIGVRFREIDVATIVGDILDALIASGRHHALIDQLINELGRLLEEYEPAIRMRVRDKTAWLWRSMRADVAVSDKIIAAAEEVIAEMSHDKEHPWRQKFDDVLAQLAHDLRSSPEYRHRFDELRAEFLGHPGVQRYLAGMWRDMRQAIEDDVARPDSLVVQALERGIVALAATLRQDAIARTRLNRWIRGAIVKVVEAQRHEVGHLIAETIRRWDTATFTRRIESYVGDDLQFIRINGTLIGGTIGLLIHAVGRFV